MRTWLPSAAAASLLVCSVALGWTACDDGGPAQTAPTPTDGPTYYGEVRAILNDNCVSCHDTGGVGPFPLTTYEAAKPLSALIVSATASRQMPPWGAGESDECQPRLGFKNDLRLSDAELDTLQTWHDNGAPEGTPTAEAAKGDGNDAAPPTPTLEGVTHTLVPDAGFTTEGVSDDFICFVMEVDTSTDTYLQGVQFNPGNALVTHHALLYIDYSGDSRGFADENGQYACFGSPGDVDGALIAAWAPGGLPLQLPANAGMDVPAGSVFVMQMHYHPTGIQPETDATTVDLALTSDKPEWTAATTLIGNFNDGSDGEGLLPGMNDSGPEAEFVIPAGQSAHKETQVLTVPYELDGQPYPGAYIWGVANHMHYVGTNMRVWIDRKTQGPPTCAAQETTNLVLCAEQNCNDAADLLACTLAQCSTEFEALGSDCTNCIIGDQTGSPLAACGGNGFAPHPGYPEVPEQPARECLLETPDWNFEWQRIYEYDAPLENLPFVAAGDKITMECTYNNTLSNPWVQEALDARGLSEPHDVVLGDETLDEMCLWVVVTLTKNYR